jgi:hypothetical protein
MAHGHSPGNANLPTLLADSHALGYRHGQHGDFNLPNVCSRPVDSDARLSNLLLTMPQRADVETERFQDSVRPVSEVVA